MKLLDRIKETSHTIGTGLFRLDGPVIGFESFNNYSADEVFYYAITDGSDYEIGSGQYTIIGGYPYITRNPIHSTNTNSYVDFQNGVKEVYVTYPGVKSVYTTHQVPQNSGIAFWTGNQSLSYDNQIVWDSVNNRLGVAKNNPSFSIDVAGLVNTSGVIVGHSGVMFSGIYGYSGGRQLEPFMRNELDSTTFTDAVFSLSGIVSQRFLFNKQSPGFIFAGPSGECPGCPSDYPTFRPLSYNDLYNIQDIVGTGLTFANNKIRTSGVGTFNKIAFPFTNGFEEQILIGTNVPLGIEGNYQGNIIIGDNAATSRSYLYRNILLGLTAGSSSSIGSCIGIGQSAAASATGTFISAIGYQAGYGVTRSQFLTAIGYDAANSLNSGIYINAIGDGSCFGSKNLIESSFIGHDAGIGCSGISYSNIIGANAAKLASGCINNNYIGFQAGIGSFNANFNNFIGSEAGANSSSDYSTYVGYKAGLGRTGNNSIIIKNTSSNDNGAIWAATSENNILDIGNSIFGALDSGSIRIGASGTILDIKSSALSVKSTSDVTTLKLLRIQNQSSPQLVADSGSPNVIITKNGHLRIPTFSNFSTATGVIGNPNDSLGVLFFTIGDGRLYISDGTSWKYASFTT